jgi:hypothetical protein
MAIETLPSNGEDYASTIANKRVFLRKDNENEAGEDQPLTFEQVDNNFELLRAKINELVAKVNELDT